MKFPDHALPVFAVLPHAVMLAARGLAVIGVTALLAVLSLRLLRQAQERGRNGLPWVAVMLASWLCVLALVAFGGRAVYAHHFHKAPGFWVVYVPAVVLASGAAFGVARWLAREPAPKTKGRKKAKTRKPETPAAEVPPPPPAPAPAPPPAAPEVTVFKFACPHCGQRIAVTTADIGSVANCPACAAPIEVPAPSPA
jgi:hypothetical protein